MCVAMQRAPVMRCGARDALPTLWTAWHGRSPNPNGSGLPQSIVARAMATAATGGDVQDRVLRVVKGFDRVDASKVPFLQPAAFPTVR